MENRQKNARPRLSIPGWLWWLMLIALLAWTAVPFLSGSQPPTQVPYSVFVAQVRAGNVRDVRIADTDITGTFARPVAWPPPTPASAGATPAPQPTPNAAFHTVFPQAVGDPTLLPLLESQGVLVEVAPPPTPWLQLLLTYGLPIILLLGFLVLMGRRAAQSQDGIFNFGRSRARKYDHEHPEVTFKDVAGADQAKADLQEIVDFLRQPAKYHDLGAHIPRGILLVGPPGTGKTLMARAIAGEASVPFFSLSASEFVEMFVGVGASRVRDLFTQAKEGAPSIVFIDELDAVGRRRGAGLGAVNDEREQTLNQLLVEMDGFDEHHEVIVLAATNRPDVLDPALLRPGRFDRQVTIDLPDRQGREAILAIHTRPLQLDPGVDLGILARTTTGFSGADLANLCNEAALIAARHNHRQITMRDFEEALDKILLGGERPLLLGPDDKRVVAYHESGHALVAWMLPNADPVHKITIIPRGRALGVTEQLPADDQYNYSEDYLLTRLSVMLGGRTAEEVAIGTVTTGPENDLVEATRLARRMITRWGMGSLGLAAFQVDEEQPFLGYELTQGRDFSEATAARIDEDVQRLLEKRHQVAQQILKAHRETLDTMAQALLHEETIDESRLEKILGARPQREAGVPSDLHRG